MPNKTHERRKHHKEESSQAGFVASELRKTMNKNEKIIMAVLIIGIIAFLALSIFVLFTKQTRNTLNNGTNPAGGTTNVNLTPYPTIPPIENMTVMVNSRRFNPASASIPRGGFVDFLNVGSESIVIEANDSNSSILNLGTIEASNDKQVTFNDPGTYTYRSKARPTMTGIITVK